MGRDQAMFAWNQTKMLLDNSLVYPCLQIVELDVSPPYIHYRGLSYDFVPLFGKMVGYASSFRRFLDHPAGLKTIHFWAPTFKWALVIAGLSDLERPPEKLSVSQNAALTCTGVIWARYSTQIIPKNYNLFSVSMFVGLTGLIQVYRIYDYRKGLSKPNESKE